MSAVSSISVLMPIKNGAQFLDRVLTSVARQKIDIPWDFLALDCGSTDGTLEIFAKHAETFPVPLRVQGIQGAEFNHGCTRNTLASLSTGELLVFMTDDAIPRDENWLAQLASNFEDPSVGGAYSRNIPRPEANILAKILCQDDPSYQDERRETQLPPVEMYARMSPFEKRVFYNFSDTSSSMRRSLWARHPYPRCKFGEDAMMARAMIEGGYTVVFDDKSVVEHSHEYDADEYYARGKYDAEFNAQRLDRVCVGSSKEVEHHTKRILKEDERAFRELGVEGAALKSELARSEELRRAFFTGLMEGSLGKKRIPATALAPGPRLAIVQFVPVDSPAASFAASLASELEARGHEVRVASELSEGATTLLVHGLTSASAQALQDAQSNGMGTLLFCDEIDPWLALPADVRAALRFADQLLVPTLSQFARWKNEASLDADQLVYSPRALPDDEGSFTDLDPLPRAGDRRERTIQEQAGEIEFRLRAVSCPRPNLRPWVRLDYKGIETSAREGDVTRKELDMVLLSAPDSAVEYPLDGAGGGERVVRVTIQTLVTDGEASLGGRIVCDGQTLAPIGPYIACTADEQRMARARVQIPTGAKSLRIENQLPGGEPHMLRVKRVELLDLALVPDEITAGEIIFDRTGWETSAVTGDVNRQGADDVLIGPGAGGINYSLDGIGVGRREFTITLALRSDEESVEMGGRVLLDDLPVARFGPVYSGGKAESAKIEFKANLAHAPQYLRVENQKRAGKRAHHLRIRRLVVRSLAPKRTFGGRMRDVLTRLRGAIDLPERIEPQ